MPTAGLKPKHEHNLPKLAEQSLLIWCSMLCKTLRPSRGRRYLGGLPLALPFEKGVGRGRQRGVLSPPHSLSTRQ